MAKVAFQTYRFIFGIQVFAVMAAETPGRINMPKVIWVRRPINFLIEKNSTIIDGLDLSHCLLDLITVLAVLIGKITLVIFFKCSNDFHGINASGIFDSQHRYSQLANGWDGRVAQTARHGIIN